MIAYEEAYRASPDKGISGSRLDLVTEYAWAIPSEEALKLILSYGPIVEIGAGGGYWAHLLRERGGDVIAYDPCPEESVTEQAPPRRVWTDVEIGDHGRGGDHPDRTLLLVWPSYDEDWAEECLRAYLAAGGQRLVYVGEDWGGCCATEEFFMLAESEMRAGASCAIPRWSFIHDALRVWERE